MYCGSNAGSKPAYTERAIALGDRIARELYRDTDYVDEEKVKAEVAHARRIFADNGWPVLDVTRRSIEESAAAIINMFNERELQSSSGAGAV